MVLSCIKCVLHTPVVLSPLPDHPHNIWISANCHASHYAVVPNRKYFFPTFCQAPRCRTASVNVLPPTRRSSVTSIQNNVQTIIVMYTYSNVYFLKLHTDRQNILDWTVPSSIRIYPLVNSSWVLFSFDNVIPKDLYSVTLSKDLFCYFVLSNSCIRIHCLWITKQMRPKA